MTKYISLVVEETTTVIEIKNILSHMYAVKTDIYF